MKKLVLAGLAGLLLFSFSLSAQAVKLSWIQKNQTVIVDDTVQVTKPNTKWDTQTKYYEDPAPVKWVRHISGANPQIYLRYSRNVTGKTAHIYAQQVKKELASRGITVSKIENKVINDRNVAFIHGSNGAEDFLVGVWRHKDLGFLLECKAEKKYFSRFMSEFNQAISSVQILKETGL